MNRDDDDDGRTTRSSSGPVTRSVKITCGPVRDGHLRATVTVMPLTDFAAGARVYVDFREVLKAASAMQRATERDLRHRDNPAALRRSGEAQVTSLTDEARDEPKARVASQLVAAAGALVTGHAETYAAEVAVPPSEPPVLGWLVRGRVATVGGRDLKSEWRSL